MSTAAASLSRPPMMVLAALGLVLATLYGGWRVASSPVPHVVSAQPSLQVGQADFTVTHVERVTGLTDADLSGMGHGIQGLVRDDDTLVRVSVTVSAGAGTTAFDASRLRLFRSSAPAGQAPVGGSVGRGRLSPHASVEGSLSFVVPRDGAHLQLGATGTTARLDLLRVDDAPPGAGDHHDHGASSQHHHEGK